MPVDPFERSVRLALDWDCNDARLVAVVEQLLAESFQGRASNVRKHLKFILQHLVRVENYATDYATSYSRNNNAYRDGIANPLRLKVRSLKSVIDRLAELGLVECHMGFNDVVTRARLSRVLATQAMRLLMDEHELLSIRSTQLLPHDGVILKNVQKQAVWYEETQETRRMKADLSEYNEFIGQQQVEIFNPEVDRPYFLDAVKSFRIFNNSSFFKGGRFYGPWWETCPKADRRRITINGEQLVELDYKANHVFLLYHLTATEMPESIRSDPYRWNETIPRDVAKKVFMLAVNCHSETEAWRSLFQYYSSLTGNIRERWEPYSRCLHYYRMAVGALVRAHPNLQGHIHQGRGLGLQFMDSQIAERILLSMTRQSLPTLGIHDSFLIQTRYEAALQEAMEEAYEFYGVTAGTVPISRTVALPAVAG